MTVVGHRHGLQYIPWSPTGPEDLAHAYRLAGKRRPIALAVAEHFVSQLAGPLDLSAQQWWHGNHAKEGYFAEPRSTDFSHVYGSGQFLWAGLWTASDPPGEAHDVLVSAWELFPGPSSRWRLPVHPETRVWEVDHPADWARLVESYPKAAVVPHPSWELPGPNRHLGDVAGLLGVPAQRAARTSVGRQLVPDWEAVAKDYDGVHLSWAGSITTEGSPGSVGSQQDREGTADFAEGVRKALGDLQQIGGLPSSSEPAPQRLLGDILADLGAQAESIDNGALRRVDADVRLDVELLELTADAEGVGVEGMPGNGRVSGGLPLASGQGDVVGARDDVCELMFRQRREQAQRRPWGAMGDVDEVHVREGGVDPPVDSSGEVFDLAFVS